GPSGPAAPASGVARPDTPSASAAAPASLTPASPDTSRTRFATAARPPPGGDRRRAGPRGPRGRAGGTKPAVHGPCRGGRATRAPSAAPASRPGTGSTGRAFAGRVVTPPPGGLYT